MVLAHITLEMLQEGPAQDETKSRKPVRRKTPEGVFQGEGFGIHLVSQACESLVMLNPLAKWSLVGMVVFTICNYFRLQ